MDDETKEQIKGQVNEYLSDFEKSKTYDVDDVEVFASGTWNGDKYTNKDLDEIVRAHKEAGGELKPYIKLGHDGDQKLLQKDGFPSAGWVTNIRREGDKLLATFKNVPKKIKELIENKAYGRFSSEIYVNYKSALTKGVYKYALKAVALLGGDTPAVKSLDDFVNLYGNREQVVLVHDDKDGDIKQVDFNEEVDMTEERVKELEAKVIELEEQVDETKKEADDATKAAEEATEKAEGLETEKKEGEEKAAEEEQKDLIDKAKELGKILPADEEKWLKMAKGDFETTKDLLGSIPEQSAVKLTEESKKGEKKTSDESEDGYEAGFETKVKELAEKKNISEAEAMIEVDRQKGE